MSRVFRSMTALFVALLAAQLVMPGAALAHERRTVGKYNFVMGFIGEPAILGQPNGIDLRITDASTSEPVTGAEKTLKASIAFGGGQAKEFALRARFGQSGGYTTDLIPMRSGTYLFNFTGDINGQAVNEKFESGPGRFNDVQAATDLQFPEVVQSPAELQRSLTEANTRATAAVAAAGQAQMFAFAGIGLGLLGVALGGMAFMNRRKEPEAAVRGKP